MHVSSQMTCAIKSLREFFIGGVLENENMTGSSVKNIKVKNQIYEN
jgi:hypothetical protein